MNKYKDSFITSIQAHPKRYLWISLLLFVVTVPGLIFIKEDFSYRIWYSEEDPLLQTFDKFERYFGNDDNLIMAIYNKKGLYNPESIKKISQLTQDMWEIPHIVRVDSLSNFDYTTAKAEEINVAPLVDKLKVNHYKQSDIDHIKAKIKAHDFLEGTYISKDEKMAILVAQVQPSYVQIADNSIITFAARDLVTKYSDENHQIQVSGTSVLTHMFKEATEEDLAILIPFVYLVFTFVFWFIYRKKSGIFIPYLIITVSILMMLGTASYLGHEINTLSGVAPNILLTVAIADTIHILTVYFFGLRQGFSNNEAVKYTLSKNFYPTLLTSITTAVGFFSFSGAKIGPIADMGVAVGIGVFYAWIATYMIVGPILQLMPKIKKNQIEHEETILDAETHIQVNEKIKNRVKFLYNVRFPILIASIILGLTSLYLGSKLLVVNLDPYTQFAPDHKFIKDINKITKHLGPTNDIDFMIYAGETDNAKDPKFLKQVEKFENWLAEQRYITKTFSINDVIKDINKNINGGDKNFAKIPDTQEEVAQLLFIYESGLPEGKELTNLKNLKSDAIHLTATWDIVKSKEANEKITIIESKAKELGLKLDITGKVPLFHDLTPYIVTSFLESFLLAFTLITILLIIVLKSFKLGLLALIPNIFPLILGAAVYGLSGEYIDMASVLIASVCLGIAVDDSIHFLFEYKKYINLNYSPTETVELIFTNTAPSLINTTLIIMLGFGTFYFANYIPNAKFGVMVSIILFFAIIADLLLLPAILFICEKDNKLV